MAIMELMVPLKPQSRLVTAQQQHRQWQDGDVIGVVWVSAGFNENPLCSPFSLHFASMEITRDMQ